MIEKTPYNTLVKKPVKVIFLDIDGVLNNRNADNLLFECDPEKYSFDKKNLKCLNYILKKVPDCKIIINSSWRNYPDDWTFENYYGDVYTSLLPTLREMYKDYIIGNSPHKDGRNKCGDVLECVDTFTHEDYSCIEDFVIIDDDPSQGLEYFSEHFFKTSKDYGLTADIAKRIVEYFNEE